MAFTDIDRPACACCADEHEDHPAPHSDHKHSHEHSHESDTGRRPLILFGAALALGAVTFIPGLLPPIVAAALLAGATVLAGYSMFIEGVKGLFKLSLDEFTLMTIAIVAAWALGEWQEAFMVTALFRLGNIFENLAVQRSRRSIAKLAAIVPQTANLLLADGTVTTVSPADVPVGSRIVVHTGERVPLDAVILEGEISVDTSALTGESVPRFLGVGDQVLSGMISIQGAPVCRTENTFQDSAAMRIISLVEDSQKHKGNTETFITRFAKVYTPVVVALAAVIAFVPPLLGWGSFPEFIKRALVFLVASCPCALVIAVPLSFFAGIGRTAKSGVLVKGSRYIEMLAKAKGVVMDKTGTITTGHLQVSETVSVGALSQEDVLRYCAAAESRSNHPIAKAVTAHYAGAIDNGKMTRYDELAGLGVSATYDGKTLLCGSGKLMAEKGIALTGLPPANLYLAVEGRVEGYIQLADELRPDAKETLASLKQMGFAVSAILTGDGTKAAEDVAAQVKADVVYSQLMPAQKVEKLVELQNTHGPCLFVGDGINDAPVLAAAGVGVAMGLGTDAAMEAADVVLVTDKLRSLCDGVRLSRKAMSVARANIIFALTIKGLVLVLGALGFAQMWMAVFADVGVTLLAVLNSMRVMTFK